MEKEEFEQELTKQLKKLKIEINQEQKEQFYTYMTTLIEWNKKINLTAITKPKEIIQKHFVDSATILKKLNKTKTLIDIGTGAGFPGIPIKILKPEIEIVLLDSLNKRINFLEETIKKLNLKNIKAIHARAEEKGQDKKYREQFDTVVSRAVANMTLLAEITIPYVKKEGNAIYMKGSEIEEELKTAKPAIKILGGKIEEVEEFYLPESNIKRNNVIVKKVENTDKKYPRNFGKIKKNPLK